MNFRVWAPTASGMDLLFRKGRHPMSRVSGGWWEIDMPDARAGERYAYSIGGGPARPDPRSRDQPDGVHKHSCLVDPDAYVWQHSGFRPTPLEEAVIYELHLGTFTREGTLDAAAEKLDHLVNLGVTHVELMPINSFEGDRGWGYDGVAWFAPHRAYTGDDGPEAVKRFVDTCHGRGLAVILDVVYNHLGPSGNYLPEFGPYFTDVYHTPWGDAMNLDQAGSDEVRGMIIDNARMWLGEYRFDALRIDAIHAFLDRSAIHLLEDLRVAVDELSDETGRDLALIAESDLNDPKVVRSRAAHGYGMDAQWSDDFHHSLHALLTGERRGYYTDYGRVEDLARAWCGAYSIDGRFSAHRGCRHGRPAGSLPTSRFLAYTQNHDQVGNRAKGDRPSQILPAPALELSTAMVILSPFVPMLFQGEEWGTKGVFQYFTSHEDKDLAEAVRAGRTQEFADFVDDPGDVPDPQAQETFQRSKLVWNELVESDHAKIHEWYTRLIRFRREHPSLRTGVLGEGEVEFSENPRWLSVVRDEFTLLFNLDNRKIKVAVDTDDGQTPLLTNQYGIIAEKGAVTLRAWGVAVFGPAK